MRLTGPAQSSRRGPPWCWAAGFLVVSALVAAALPVHAHESAVDSRPIPLREVAFNQRVNEQIPPTLEFRDETGRTVRLSEYFGTRPIILVPVYYRCLNLCPLVLDGLVRTLRAISLNAGDEFTVVAVSFDPRDFPGIAAAKKAEILQRYARPGAEEGWRFLTGEQAAIQQLTQAIGFRFTDDRATDQYAHAAGIILLTPQGKIFRYMYGIEFSPRDLRLSLVEASENKVGSPIDQALLFCYRYDATTGKYSVIVMNVLRLADLLTVGALGSFIIAMWRREHGRAVAARRGT